MGLLVRRSGGFSKPNHLYVKIPSDEIVLQPIDNKAVEKMAVIESEKPPSSGRKNGCAGVGNVAPVYTDQIEHTARWFSAWLPPIQCTLSGHQCMILIQG